jgi:hypothetical protein
VDIISAIQSGPKSVKELTTELNEKFTDIAKQVRILKDSGEVVIVNGMIALPNSAIVTSAITTGATVVDGQIKTALGQSIPTSSNRGRKVSGNSKTAIAKRIFAEMAGKSRKEVIERFITEAELTPAGASTYYANFKKANG